MIEENEMLLRVGRDPFLENIKVTYNGIDISEGCSAIIVQASILPLLEKLSKQS